MASPRHVLVDPLLSEVFHCWGCCVRRAFLCGWDAYSGRDYEHRRGWIRDRLEELVGLFAVEVHSYSVMSNHLHVVVRTLPQRVGGWDDEEVARRWLRLFPGKRKNTGRPPEDCAVRALCEDAERLAKCRRRLADLSWFMRCLNEWIARRANEEDEVTGHFWEGRFKCEKLDDPGAALACMAYVDLNPVRAGMAATPEDSEFTSAQDRAVAMRARRQLARLARRSLDEEGAPDTPHPAQAELIARAQAESRRDHWLAPIGGARHGSSDPSPRDPSPLHPPPLLPQFSEERYLELLDWTGRQFREDKRGRMSADLRPALERIDLDVEAWVDNVARYGSLFHCFAGKLHRLREAARAAGRAWFQGRRGARALYARERSRGPGSDRSRSGPGAKAPALASVDS